MRIPRIDPARWFVVVAALLLFVACGGGERSGSATRLPHVIVISLDTTRADFLGAHGSSFVRTPTLDRLARESVLFRRCRTVAPTTLASHTSILTGTHPHTHGVARNGFTVNQNNRMLAEILREQGYRTAGFIGSFALDQRFGIAQGFDDWNQDFDRLDGMADYDQDQRDAAAVTDAVLAYVDGVASGGGQSPRDDPSPLFLFAHYFDPHLPYEPAAVDAVRYGDPDPAAPVDIGLARSALDAARGGGPPEQARQAQAAARRLVQRYAGEVTGMDRQIGRLLAALRRRGILENSLVVVVSDHGENHADHAFAFDHGHTLYQSVLHAVCMVRVGASVRAELSAGERPRSERVAPRVEHAATMTIDILPTLLGLLGLSVPSRCEGEDLFAGENPRAAGGSVFAEATKPWDDVEVSGRWTNSYKARCVVTDRWKYIVTPYRSSEELYDLQGDPGERRERLAVADDETEAVRRRLRGALDAWAAGANPLASAFDDSQQRETIERLRRMGYLDPRGRGDDGR